MTTVKAPTRHWVAALIAAVGLALVLGGCDDDGGNGPSAGGNGAPAPGGDGGDGADVDPCELLTTAEVEEAVGNPVNEPTPDVANACDWDTDDPDLRNVTVATVAVPDPDICVDAIGGDPAYEELDGFDVPAFASFNAAAGGLADVVLCAEGAQLQVIVNGGFNETANEAELRSAAEGLAELVAGRI